MRGISRRQAEILLSSNDTPLGAFGDVTDDCIEILDRGLGVLVPSGDVHLLVPTTVGRAVAEESLRS